MTFKTEQEKFWAGDFGNEYTIRNDSDNVVAANVSLFTKAFQNRPAPQSIIEFGANRGMNIHALKALFPNAEFTALEINSNAVEELKKIDKVNAVNTSIFDYDVKDKYDLSLIKGVLIHINPDELPGVYKKLYESSQRYILVAEYYNPSPVTVSYRGHSDRLFKRDFAGEMLDMYKDLRLVDYGFCYHRDRAFPLDDITWFLLEKTL